MSTLKLIQSPIKEEMKIFEQYFRSSMKSKVALLDIITNYIIRSKGKQMRPMLVFLTAKLVGKVNDSTYNAASLIELLHTATLVHDDVVDEANERRGFFSINALWKNKIAILVGDYLLSRGLLLAVDKKEFELLKIVSVAVREMSEGELLQIEKARKLDITEEVYFDIIEKKTATLIASCTIAGASSAGADKETLERIGEFGKYLGIAFQIKDDLFDYLKTNLTGKPSGNDIKEKKMTLPLIHALSKASAIEKRQLLRLIKNKRNNKVKVEEVTKFVIDKGGIEYATNKMNEFRQKAHDILSSFPDNEARVSLYKLVDFTITRES